ncbi:Aa_trans domain-containing protein [Mucor velutinosus]|uniref:Aa_trans domain-containing protein n=1 Tax=Mucor velutinosus TaxID=708070 RepID=A0AAN7DPN7_9FUNG|nr:Aa_trans domain-containing protein [Mucor velutinosus]
MTDTLNDASTRSSSPSWLKQRTSMFNNNAALQASTTTNATAPPVVKKVVDKELASLKKIGAVSSVWSNKFVQEDNSGGTNTIQHKITPSRNYHITSPPLHPLTSSSPSSSSSPSATSSSSDPSLSPRRSNKVNTSPRPNADYIPVTGTRQSFSNNSVSTTTQPTSPRSPLFDKVRSFSSSSSKSMSDEIQQALDQHQPQQQQRLSKQQPPSLGYFSKASMSSLDLNDMEDSNRSSTASSFTANGFSSPPLRRSIETDRTSTKTASTTTTTVNNSMDEAAALWFQCETLKTQYAQNNARLNKAMEDVEFYKRQLEQQGEISRQGIADAVEEKEKEIVRVRQLAQLIVKQDQLLEEYQINLDMLTQLTNESSHLEETQAEMAGLRQELAAFKKEKQLLEGTIAALRAELEMSQGQMKLMMAVSTEIQKEYARYKSKINYEIKAMMRKQQDEHESELKVMQEQLSAATTAAAAAAAAPQERSVVVDSDAKEMQEMEALSGQVSALNQALEAKDKVIADLKNQLTTQKMSMDTQMMELTQSILEKDALLMEFMSSRNNSREVLPQQQQQQPASQPQATRSMITTSVAPAAETSNYYHPASPQHYQQQQQDSQLHVSQIRDYMYDDTSDEDDDEEQEQIHYTSDEEEHDQEESNTLQEINHYHHLMTHESSVPQSPADSISSSISSTISFDSSEEEEKVAEIKHFSYSSVQSNQQTRPVSLINTAESLGGDNGAQQDMMDDVSRRLSNASPTSNAAATTARFSVSKENSANWPMPPPTPPPSEPLPPVPVAPSASVLTPAAPVASVSTPSQQQQQQPEESLQVNNSMTPPPRRARSKTMARDEAPNMSEYTTSIHQNNELPRIIPLQRDLVDVTTATAPIPPPRKDIQLQQEQQQPHTKWMDDPESEEDDMWCETNTTTTIAAL